MWELFKKILLISIILFSIMGCENNSSQEDQMFSFSNTEYSQLMDHLMDLEVAISMKQILEHSPDRQRVAIDTAINRARSGLLLLAKTGERTLEDKKKAHSAFVDAIKQYEYFRILEIEQDRFDQVFNQVRYLKFQLGEELGIDEANETWTVFNHNFSTSGLEPTFTTMGFNKSGKPSDEAKWFTNFQTDIPKARAQGRDGSYGWMISRPFDLSEVENPSFRYFGSYLVVAPNNVLPLSEVITQVFKTYILLDYKQGDNPEDYPEDRKILVEYNLDDLPLGRDFDDAWVPYVNLNPYRDHKVAIGFLFDTRGINFTQYYSWTVFDFEINGAGKIKEDPVKYKQNFTGSDLGIFKSYSLEFPGENWTAEDLKAKIKFVPSAQNKNDEVDTFLLSPKLDISKNILNPVLRIKESFLKENFNVENLKNLEILISKEFKGGTSPLNSEWNIIERNLESLAEGKNEWSMSHDFSLEEFKGQEIVVAFRFKAQNRSLEAKPIDWSIEAIEVLGEESAVAAIDYMLDDPVKNFRLAYFDFKNLNIKDFVIESTAEAPLWQKKENGWVISGFGGPGNPALMGPSRLILPRIDLTGKDDARVRLRQKVFFYRDNSVSAEVVKINVRKLGETQWNVLELPVGTLRDNMPRDPELSSWISLPKEYLGSKIELSFLYQARSGNGGTVEWTMGTLEVGSK